MRCAGSEARWLRLRETDPTSLGENPMLTNTQIPEIHSHLSILQRKIYLLVLYPAPASVGSYD